MTNFEFNANERETIRTIANKYNYMQYYEYTEIDCFCITLSETTFENILSFISELNRTIKSSHFILYYESLFDDNSKLDFASYVVVTSSDLLNAFIEYTNE